MSRSILLSALFGLAAIASGCSGSSAPLNDDAETPNLTMAGPGDAPPASSPTAEPTPLESPPALDPWMKLPPMVLEAEATHLLRCGLPQESRSKCNLTFHEGAYASSSAKEDGPQRYALKIWVTVASEVYGTPPMAPLPRAPFRVVHHFLPGWHQADAWLTFALRNARRKCGMQTRVGNARVWVGADFGIQNTYVIDLEIGPHRPSVVRDHLECIAGEEEMDDVNAHADALSAGLPWKGARSVARK
ncbi:hypothetical protein U1839_21690 [Sphingomonas sp. RT2P30]|uniref:hypothetical protein n=1 Tax=Parasphingomonas halimpatiens TaxID=3096162 RepID=UPI002FCA1E67